MPTGRERQIVRDLVFIRCTLDHPVLLGLVSCMHLPSNHTLSPRYETLFEQELKAEHLGVLVELRAYLVRKRHASTVGENYVRGSITRSQSRQARATGACRLLIGKAQRQSANVTFMRRDLPDEVKSDKTNH